MPYSPGMSGSIPLRERRAELSVAWPGVLAIVGAALGQPMVWAGATLLACALARRPSWRSVPGILPTACVLLAGYLTVALMVASWCGLQVLHSRAACLVLMSSASVLFTALAMGAVARAPERRPARQAWPGWGWLAPAALMGALGVVPLVLGPGTGSGWFFAGDHLRMLLITVGEWRQGSLSYAMTTYPQAWSTLVAVIWAGGGAADSSRGFLSLSRVMAASCWFDFALVTLGASRLAVLLARDLRLPRIAAALAGALAGLTTMTPWFAGSYLAKGFENSILAVLCLVAMGIELVEARGTRWSVVAVGAAGVVMAHTWQLFLPSCGTAFLLAVQGVWTRRGARAALSSAVVTGIPAAVLALPGAVAVVKQSAGLGHAAQAGDVPALAWPPLVAVLVCTGLLLRQGGASSGVRAYLTVVGVTMLTAPLVAVVVGVSLSTYYPNKVIWGAVVLGLPVVAAVWLRMMVQADSRQRRTAFIALGAGAGICSAIGVLSPLTAPFGAWSTVDGGAVVRIMSAPGADHTQVFWSGRPGPLDPTVQILLAMYGPKPAAAIEEPLPTGSVAEQCARLNGSSEPRVLTTATVEQARARFTCAPGAAVIRTPGR